MKERAKKQCGKRTWKCMCVCVCVCQLFSNNSKYLHRSPVWSGVCAVEFGELDSLEEGRICTNTGHQWKGK